MIQVEDYGWAAFWSNGSPTPFILVQTCSGTRKEVCEQIGEVWALPGQTPMEGWRRAYRRGCRAIRVTVRTFGSGRRKGERE